MNPEAFWELVQAEAAKRGLSEAQAVEALWAFAALNAPPGAAPAPGRPRRAGLLGRRVPRDSRAIAAGRPRALRGGEPGGPAPAAGGLTSSWEGGRERGLPPPAGPRGL